MDAGEGVAHEMQGLAHCEVLYPLQPRHWSRADYQLDALPESALIAARKQSPRRRPTSLRSEEPEGHDRGTELHKTRSVANSHDDDEQEIQ